MPYPVYCLLIVLVVCSLLVISQGWVCASDVSLEPPRNPQEGSEASDLAPLPTVQRERTMMYWAMWFIGGLLLLAGIVYLIRPRI